MVDRYQNSTIEQLHDAFRRLDAREAWKIYKRLNVPAKHTHDDDSMKNEQATSTEASSNTDNNNNNNTSWNHSTRLHPDDHSTMLSFLTLDNHPALAARHACIVAFNILQSGYHLDVRDYNALMTCHLRNKDPRKLVGTFRSMIRNEEPPLFPSAPPEKLVFAEKWEGGSDFEVSVVIPDKKSYMLLMAAYVQARMPEEVAHVFREMTRLYPAAKSEPEAYALLIDACGATVDVKGAEMWFERFGRAVGAVPDRRVLNSMVKSLGSCGEIRRALELFEGFWKKYAVEWDESSFDAAISALEVADDLEGAEVMWERLLKYLSVDFKALSGSENVEEDLAAGRPLKFTYWVNLQKPLLCTFARLMRLNAAKGNYYRVMELYKVAERLNPPDEEVTSIVVEMFLRMGEHEKGKELYSKMVDLGFLPSEELVEIIKQAEAYDKAMSR
jgi:pentatricopeptide repeat protein